MPRLPRHPAVWLTALLGWFGLLWFLSSLEGGSTPTVPLPNFDKFEHFSYFFVGGLLAAGWFQSLRPDGTSWRRILLASIALMAVLAFIDEWHQCYTPGRSGADAGDWLADMIGAACGALTLKRLRRKIS